VRDPRGGLVDEFDWTQVISIPLIRLAGELRGISPLEAERLTFQGAIAAEELAGRFLRSGTWLSALLEMPATGTYDDDTIEKLRAGIEKKWSGTRNSGKVGVLTGGAKLTQLSVTPEQAQFLQTRMYDDERIFRIFRCPPALVGMTREGATSYASSVMQADAFEKHTIRPLLDLIESAYGALAEPGRYLRFNTAALLRADLTTRVNSHGSGLDHKWVTVDEVRAIEDLDPLGGVEGGLLQTPNNNAPGAPAPEPAPAPRQPMTRPS
jgi:HK97 family phage portal protein